MHDKKNLTTEQCLGMILAKVESLENNSSKTTYLLIGIIAAQIGVKVLGTDPLLDIATALAFIGGFLLLGTLMFAWKRIRVDHKKLSKTGWWLSAFVLFALATQIMVYFRDLGILEPRVIYTVRIVQNLTIIGFAWTLMGQGRLWLSKDKE